VAHVDGELITLARLWAKELAVSFENDYDDIEEQDFNSLDFEGNEFFFYHTMIVHEV
jgi:5-bromo-4-chloroindolyl phosphate hydrolysis protein